MSHHELNPTSRQGCGNWLRTPGQIHFGSGSSTENPCKNDGTKLTSCTGVNVHRHKNNKDGRQHLKLPEEFFPTNRRLISRPQISWNVVIREVFEGRAELEATSAFLSQSVIYSAVS